MLVDLSGKTALITGARGGVGRATALVLAGQGADVALGIRSAPETVSGLVEEVEAAGRRAMVLQMDVTVQSAAEQAVGRILSDWGHLDILVNNASVIAAPGWIERDEDRPENWDVALDVNVKGIVICCQAVAPHMIERRYGKIINISSIVGRPAPGAGGDVTMFAYSASKAAVIRYTQCLASLLAPHNVNVNGVAPGPMFTQMGLDFMRQRQRRNPSLAGRDIEELRREAVIGSNMFGRELLPEDIAKATAFLASDDARNIAGQNIPVDGGLRMV